MQSSLSTGFIGIEDTDEDPPLDEPLELVGPTSGNRTTPSLPHRLGPYELLAELGAGGMAVVYLAKFCKVSVERKCTF